METEVKLSPSSLGQVATCTTQAWLSKRLGLSTREETAALRSGGDAHAAMAHYLRTRGDVAGAMQVFEQAYREWSLENVLTGEPKAWENARTVVESWFQMHSDVEQLPFTYDPADVERKVEVDLCEVDGVQVKLRGYIDLPCRDRTTGARHVLDHKFTGWLTSDTVAGWKLSAQFKAYAWMWEQAAGEQVTGVLVNGVEWSRIPEVQYLKSGQEKKCKTHGVPYSECRTYHARKQIMQLTLMPSDLEIWLADARRLACGFVGIWVAFDRAGVDPREAVDRMPQEGTFSGACRWCEYKRFCAAGRQPFLIRSMMVERKERE